MSAPDDGGIPLNVASIVSHRTHKGIVTITLGDVEIQVPPEQGRDIAQWINEACEAAETDEFLLGWLMTILGERGSTDGENFARATAVLRDFREARVASRGHPSTRRRLFDREN